MSQLLHDAQSLLSQRLDQGNMLIILLLHISRRFRLHHGGLVARQGELPAFLRRAIYTSLPSLMPTARRRIDLLGPLAVLAAVALNKAVRAAHASVLASGRLAPHSVSRALYRSHAATTPTAREVLLLLPESVGSAGSSLAAHSADHFVRGAQLRLLPDAFLRARAVVHHELPVSHAVANHLHAAIRANMGEIIPHQTFLPAGFGQAFYASEGPDDAYCTVHRS